MNAPRTVMCHRLKQELPALPFRPFQNDFGQLLYDKVSLKAWQEWLRESPRYINTYRLDLQSEEGKAFMEKQMRLFFNFEVGEMADTAWRPVGGDG